MPQPQQCGIWAASATYTTVHGNAGSLTYWARPGIEPTCSWILVGFLTHWATTGTLRFFFVSLFLVVFGFLSFVFLETHSQHMEVPRLGVWSELQLLAYPTAIAMPDLSRICDLHHSSQKRQILNLLSEARDQTHNPMVPSQIHFRCATMGAPQFSFLILIIYIFFFLCQPN